MFGGDSPVWPAWLAVALVCLATVGVGAVGLRLSRTTSDFYVAGRMISPRWNASAIGGEYLSAASFLGVAGLLLAYGVDVLWYPVGYTAGFLAMLVLVAAPLRRSGAYTLPDFAEFRLASRAVRAVTSVLVVGIGWLYLLPQFQGAGLALRTVTGAPEWVGSLLVAVVVLVNVAAGGMRSITFVQAFQFWLKLTAIAAPVALLLVFWRADGAPDPFAATPARTRHATTVEVPETVRLRVETPVTLDVHGVVDGRRVDGPLALSPGRVTVAEGTRVTLPAGAAVPPQDRFGSGQGSEWVTPATESAGREHPLYRIYSLLLALLFGTMGLPHVLVRFYTNPDGRAARRTTVTVIGLVGLFYLFPPIYGALGRSYAPELLLTGRTDAVVLLLPGQLLPSTPALITSALLTAGAFAAFLSTSSGLAVSVAGVLGQDLLGGRYRRTVSGFRQGSVLAVLVPALLAVLTPRTGLADSVSLAFAVASATFAPLLILGIWWPGLTRAGALTGLVVGGTLSSAAVLITLAGKAPPGLPSVLLALPAAWTVPTVFAVMVLVSLRTRSTLPPGAHRLMVRLHAPERLELAGPDGAARGVPTRERHVGRPNTSAGTDNET